MFPRRHRDYGMTYSTIISPFFWFLGNLKKSLTHFNLRRYLLDLHFKK